MSETSIANFTKETNIIYEDELVSETRLFLIPKTVGKKLAIVFISTQLTIGEAITITVFNYLNNIQLKEELIYTYDTASVTYINTTEAELYANLIQINVSIENSPLNQISFVTAEY